MMIHLKVSAFVIFILILLSPYVALSQENTIGKSIVDNPNAIIIQGDLLKKFHGYPINNFALFRYYKENWEPIPFQIDERDSHGLLVLPQGARPNVDDELKEIFDANDEIVFMSNDLGDKVDKSQLPQSSLLSAEIEAEEPQTGNKGWAYLVLVQNQPPSSNRDYVEFISENETCNVSATNYSLSFQKGKIYYSKLALKNNEKGEEIDVLDRTKFRSSVRLKWWLFYFLALKSFSKNEDDAVMRIQAFKDGPVRLILRGKPEVKLIMSWKLPSEVLDSIYYYNQVEVVSLISSPVNIGAYCMGASFRAGFDFNSIAKGMLFYNNNNPVPTQIDGEMDKQEEHLDLSHYNWMVITGSQGTMINRVVLSPSLKMLRNNLYYMDDATIQEPPEGETGQHPQIGYTYSLLPIKKGKHRIYTYLYFPSHFEPGYEKYYLDMLDNPLTISISNAVE